MSEEPTVIAKAIRTLLESITDPEPKRAFSMRAPQGTDGAGGYYIVRRVDVNRLQWFHLQGSGDKADARIQVDSYHPSYEEADKMAGRARQKLHGFQGVAGGVTINSCRSENDIDDEETDRGQKLFRVISDYFVIYTEV